MYSAHIKDEISTLRIFKDTGSYEERSVPVFSCTVHYISDTDIYICNAVGEFSREIMKTIRTLFINKGYKLCTYERRGKFKVLE